MTIMVLAITMAHEKNNGKDSGEFDYCCFFFLLFLFIYPSSHSFLHPSIQFLPLSIFQHYRPSVSLHLPVFLLSFLHSPPLSPGNLSPPPPPSLFLANLKFVRRLRLLDGWPLIFCELHLAQTSLRPWCILLTTALVAGPRHLS